MAQRSLKTILISLSSIFVSICPAYGQLIPDRTLGRESSAVVPVSDTRDNIRGGARRGSNLFHSFREFNVNSGRQVYFDNPIGVQNIINRVTGSNISNIFGTLGVNGNANLYLINPNGIAFGEGAFLDINGTFIGTTADGVRLGANDVYSATDPGSSSLLTIQPEALFVNRKNAALKRAIINQDNLEVKPRGNLTLSGDSIENNGSIAARSGDVFLEAINGDINTGNIDVSSLAVNGESLGNGGDIKLKATENIIVNDEANIRSTGILGGSINIESQGALKANNAAISSNSTGNVIGKGGDIKISANLIQLINGTRISTKTEAGVNGGNLSITAQRIEAIGSNINEFNSGLFAEADGEGNGGNITINTDSLRLENGAQINATTLGQGNGGNINIFANEIVLKDFISGLFTPTQGEGNAGNITINTDMLRLENDARISAITVGRKQGGNLIIFAKEIVLISSGVFTQTGSEGNAGEIRINTDSLRVLDGSQINTGTDEPGNAGNLTISAKDIEVIGVRPNSNIPSGLFTATRGEGNAGEIRINTDSLRVLDGARISTTTNGQSNAGNLTISAKNIEVIGVNPNNNAPSALLSQTRGEGNAGDIKINTNSLRLEAEAAISAGTFGAGNGGNLTISAQNIELISSNLFSQTQGEKNAGDIRINTDSLRVLDGAQISASTSGAGNGGNLTISAQNIELIGTDPNNNAPSGLLTATVGEGNAGDLIITAIDLLISDRAAISAQSRETGNSGNVEVLTEKIRILNNGSITVSSTKTGMSGNIKIEGNSLSLDRGIINAENISGQGGNINIILKDGLNLAGGSTITAAAGIAGLEAGNGGNITIDAPLIIASPRDNLITANAFGGAGGNININTDAILGYPQFLTLTASSDVGIDGTISIEGLSDEIRRGELLTPTPAIDAEAILANDICAVKDGQVAGGSSFTIPGKGGIIPSPLQGVDRNRGMVEWSDRPDNETRIRQNNRINERKRSTKKIKPISEIAQNQQKPKKLEPAVGWYRRTDGTVVLTSNPALVRPLNEPIDYPPRCGE